MCNKFNLVPEHRDHTLYLYHTEHYNTPRLWSQNFTFRHEGALPVHSVAAPAVGLHTGFPVPAHRAHSPAAALQLQPDSAGVRAGLGGGVLR